MPCQLPAQCSNQHNLGCRRHLLGRAGRAAAEAHAAVGHDVAAALRHDRHVAQRGGQRGAGLRGGQLLGAGAGAAEGVVEVVQLHGVGGDDGARVSGEGGGLVHDVPQPVTVHDHGDVERHRLLQHEGDPVT